jgi:hypothetical protein
MMQATLKQVSIVKIPPEIKWVTENQSEISIALPLPESHSSPQANQGID